MADEESSDLPARRLSSAELEAVIRRATELQASGQQSPDGVDPAEVVRIGRELGLPEQHLQQAIAEVRGRGEPDDGALAQLFGPRQATAARVIGVDAERARAELERYFTECEQMALLRRRPSVLVFERGRGMAAAVARMNTAFSARTPRVNARTLSVAVEPLEAGRCYAVLTVDLGTDRNALFAGGVAAGGGSGGTVAAVILTVHALAPPLALLGVPVFGAVYLGMRAAYGAHLRQTQTRLESLLDRLESGELLPRSASWTDALRKLTY